MEATGLVVCVYVRAYGTIWRLDTFKGLDSRLGTASSDRQDQQHRDETVKYEPHHGARCQRGTQHESRDQGAEVVFGLPSRRQWLRYERVMSHDHGGPAGWLWTARNGSTTVHLPSVHVANHPTRTDAYAVARDNDSRTPLRWAAMKGHPAAAQALLEAGADTSLKSSSGKTALDIAVMNSNAEVAALLGCDDV